MPVRSGVRRLAGCLTLALFLATTALSASGHCSAKMDNWSPWVQTTTFSEVPFHEDITLLSPWYVNCTRRKR